MPLAICGIPELPEALRPPVSHVISFLDPSWPEPAALEAWPKEKRHLFRYDDIVAPAAGMIAPDEALIADLVESFDRIVADQPERLLIHCHAGRSRSTATGLVWLWYRHRLSAAALAQALISYRPGAWPNTLILALADRLLGAKGILDEAGRLVHRRTAREDVTFTDWLATTRRRDEVLQARERGD
ncbi:MAG TPA: hypothetical protein VJL84_03100 [Kiloniellales bacterium]|nr:hypothetical protein [Kiloniellales bacterium]